MEFLERGSMPTPSNTEDAMKSKIPRFDRESLTSMLLIGALLALLLLLIGLFAEDCRSAEHTPVDAIASEE